jgi:methionyl-tRNA formyltransferase
MDNKIIICGQGHGIRCVYNGLLKAGIKFSLCTEDKSLINDARDDGVICVDHYLNAIDSKKNIVLTAAYKPKISYEHLQLARFINIHYALLPRYRGMHAIVWAILNGEKHVGFTLHETSELLDQGSIIYQKELLIAEKTSWELMIEIDSLVENCIADAIINYSSGMLEAKPQNENNAIFVAPRNLTDCEVIWDKWDAVYFARALKALVPPYPRPYFIYQNVKIELTSAEVIFNDYVEINGHLVYIDKNSVFIKIPGGLLRVYKFLINEEDIKNAPEYFKKIGLRF